MYDFLHVLNSGMGMTEYCHSGHMEKDKPGGANILFLDSHAAWRKWKLEARAIFIMRSPRLLSIHLPLWTAFYTTET
jgi:prepilin-type processing-associated H-X9-DG protein